MSATPHSSPHHFIDRLLRGRWSKSVEKQLRAWAEAHPHEVQNAAWPELLVTNASAMDVLLDLGFRPELRTNGQGRLTNRSLREEAVQRDADATVHVVLDRHGVSPVSAAEATKWAVATLRRALPNGLAYLYAAQPEVMSRATRQGPATPLLAMMLWFGASARERKRAEAVLALVIQHGVGAQRLIKAANHKREQGGAYDAFCACVCELELQYKLPSPSEKVRRRF